MCNLYSLTRTRDELVNLFAIANDASGGAGFGEDGIYPDMLAPVVRLDERGTRELSAMRWGFPPPPSASRPVTNVRNVASPFWRNWLNAEFRCLVPATSFCEWSDTRPKAQHWFEIAATNPPPVFAFAGIWRPWRGTRKGVSGDHRVFSFLTCQSNDVVRPVHAKAMPVVLAGEEEWDLWLTGATEDALELQRPCPAERLRIAVASRGFA